MSPRRLKWKEAKRFYGCGYVDEKGITKGTGISVLTLVVISLVASSLTVGAGLLMTAPQLSSTGEQSIALVLVCFPDASPTKHPKYITDLVVNNVSDALRQLSYGKTWLTAQATDWLLLGRNLTSYGNGGEDYIVKDAVHTADPLFDFSQFDRLVVVHAGHSYQYSGLNSSYPSTSWNNLITPTMDGRTFVDRILVPENATLRDYLHELGHAFGAVDLYNLSELDPDVENPPEYMGSWCLMDKGYQMCLFSELKVGWLGAEVIVALGQQSISVELVGVAEPVLGYKGVRVDLNATSYYLVEARTAVGLDQYKREGVIVTLVNEAIEPGHGIVRAVHSGGESLWDAAVEPTEPVSIDGAFFMYVAERTEHGFRVQIGHETSIMSREELLRSPPPGNMFCGNAAISERQQAELYFAVQREIYYPGWLQYIEVLKSHDGGSTWTTLFNTTSLGYNCSNPAIQVLNHTPVLACIAWNSSYVSLIIIQGINGNQTYLGPRLCTGVTGLSMVPDLVEPVLHIAYHNRSLVGSVVEYVLYADWNGSELTSIGTPVLSASTPHLVLDREEDTTYCFFYNTTSRGCGASVFGQGYSFEEWRMSSPYARSGVTFDAIAYGETLTLALTEYCYSNEGFWWETRIVEGAPDSGFTEILFLNHTGDATLFFTEPQSGLETGLICYNISESHYLLTTLSGEHHIILTEERLDFIIVPDWNTCLLNASILGIATGSGGRLTRFILYNAPSEPYNRPKLYVIGSYRSAVGLWEYSALLLVTILALSFIGTLGSRDVFLVETFKEYRRGLRQSLGTVVATPRAIVLFTVMGVLLMMVNITLLPVVWVSCSTYQLSIYAAVSLLWDVLLLAPIGVLLYILAKILTHVQDK